jgi:metal-responsive CopG/Arc/MetJ family transcriptional regulator
MSKTISITIPTPLEKELKEESKKQGVSRSRFICNLLLTWSENKKEKLNEFTSPL